MIKERDEAVIRVRFLTSKQRNLLEALSKDSTTKKVAHDFHVSQRAIEYMLQRIYETLGVSTLVGAVVTYKEYCFRRDNP